MIETLAEGIWLVPGLPLLGALATALFGRALGRAAALPVILGIGLAAFVSLRALLTAMPADGGEIEATAVAFEWLRVADMTVPIEFRLDGLSLAMIAMVTSVATLIAVFAAGYMADDPAKPRFFAVVGLFVTAMTGLVLSNNFVLTYAFWEGVGVCSYLLIGHYHAKHSASAAAKKAFLMNRVGDVGFALAIFMIWMTFDYSTRYDDALSAEAIAGAPAGAVAAILFLLFWAATAKSAQIPLYTWLPDAMEGPTPVSALIHAATMVTAGVYLLARTAPMLAAEPQLQALVAVIGCLTALLAALIALTQTDLKRVLAYSTVSQLGFMFMALGAGVSNVAQFAVVAAMFHLLTHAFFKALLFLGSGSVMHATGGVIDMRRFGGLARRLPITCATFGIGSLALAGFPLTAGFFSKEEVLVSLREASRQAEGNGGLYFAIYALALITAFLTAFYIGRAFCLTFLGPERLPKPDDPEAEPDEAQAHGHGHGHADDHGHGHGHEIGKESPAIMTIPLGILAVLSLASGYYFASGHRLAHYLETTPTIHDLAHAPDAYSDPTTMILSIVSSLGGLALSWAVYRNGFGRGTLPDRMAAGALRPAYKLSRGKFFVDEIYEAAVVTPTRFLAKLSMVVDKLLVEPLTMAFALIPKGLARAGFARTQNGLTQSYAMITALCMAFLLLVLLLRK